MTKRNGKTVWIEREQPGGTYCGRINAAEISRAIAAWRVRRGLDPSETFYLRRHVPGPRAKK